MGVLLLGPIGPVAQPWRRLSRPKSRFRDGRGTARWVAIACIAQLELLRSRESCCGTATHIAEGRRRITKARQNSRDNIAVAISWTA